MEEKIRAILEALQAPLSASEVQAGWTRNVKRGYISVFTDLLEQTRAYGEPQYFGIARSLDAYGIGSGELYDQMLEVANETNEALR